MGWYGNTKVFKNLKKKKEMVEYLKTKELKDESVPKLVKIENQRAYFKFTIKEQNLFDDNKTYSLIYPIGIDKDFRYVVHEVNDYNREYLVNNIIEDYDDITLLRTVWKR